VVLCSALLCSLAVLPTIRVLMMPSSLAACTARAAVICHCHRDWQYCSVHDHVATHTSTSGQYKQEPFTAGSFARGMRPTPSQLLAGGQRRAALSCRPFQPCHPARHGSGVAVCATAATAAPEASTSAPAAASSSHAAAEGPSYRANLDFKFIKENVDLVAENCKNRMSSAEPHKVVELYDQYVKMKSEADQLRAERNENSSAMKVGQLVRGVEPG
jgi:hypothetical protein